MDPGMHHVATLTRLRPGAKYYYVVGDDSAGGGGFSQEFSFTAAPAPGPDATVKILAVADMGQGEEDGSMEMSEMMPSINTTRCGPPGTARLYNTRLCL